MLIRPMLRPIPLLLLFSLAFSLAACAPEPDPDGEAPGDTADGARTEPVETEPEARPGVDLETLLARAFDRDEAGRLVVLDELNEPASVEVETRENRHIPGQIDTVRTRRYEGLSLTVYRTADGKEILQQIRVDGPGYRTEEGVRVGASRSAVEDAWGDPAERRNGAYVYERDGPLPTRVRVYFEGDTVSRLEWDYPVD